jgi:hypothetical protein
VQDTLAAAVDPQTVANGYIVDCETAGGVPFQLVGAPMQYDETPPQARRAPEFNEHGDDILQEVGLDWDAIEQHHAALPGDAGASAYLQEVLSMVARERSVEVSSIVEILKDGGAADEVAHGKDVHRRADELEKQFVQQPLQVSPACWWSAQEMTPAKIESLSDRLRAQVAGARLSDSIEIDASHERLVYHPTFIESAARKLAADRE